MKRLLLLFLGTACGSVMFGQGMNQKVGKLSAPKAAQDKASSSVGISSISNKKTRQAVENFWTIIGKKVVVGKTTYDLQTNGSTQRRVQQSGNTISCGWTYSMEAALDENAAFADRGTGYNYYDGTTWGAQPTARIENIRTGFGGFVGNGGTAESYIAHDGTNYNMVWSKKSGSSWTQSNAFNTTAHSALWPHAAASGNYLYVITSSSDSNIHANGIRNGVYLSRSNDGGVTWIDNQIPVPLLDSVNMYRAGGNSYAISAMGNNVAMVFGDVGTDLTLISSNDNGNTWTKTVIWDWPIDNYNFAGTNPTDYDNDLVIDTLWTVDGSQTLTIDKNGKVHVAFPLTRVFKDGSSTGYSFFYDTRLAYWNSDMASVADSVQEIDQFGNDCSGNGSFGIGSNYTGDNATDPDAIYNTIGTLSMPCITTTNSTPVKVMIAYTALMDNDTTTQEPGSNDWSGASALDGQNFRDVMMIGTTDNGNTWSQIVNISGTGHFEEVYPSMAENVSGNTLAILYQADNEPGTLMQNNDAAESYWHNLMICHTISIDSFFNNWGADTNSDCAQLQLPLATSHVNAVNGNVSVYPNPANDLVHVNLVLNQSSNNVVFQIADLMGRVVYSDKVANVSTLNKTINLNNLSAGNYILQVITDSGRYTEKITKE